MGKTKNFENLESREPAELNYGEGVQVAVLSLILLFIAGIAIGVTMAVQGASVDNVLVVSGFTNLVFALLIQPILVQKILIKKTKGLFAISFLKALGAGLAGLAAAAILVILIPVGIAGLIVWVCVTGWVVQKLASREIQTGLQAHPINPHSPIS